MAAVLLATFAVVLLTRRPGHWWGDDWALYVRQADSIFSGRVGEVVADNRFTVEVSGLPAFSPPMYPWGFALLLSPFVAVLGTDLDRLVLAQAFFFCWFLTAWYLLARRRVGLGLAMGGLVVLALSPTYVRWAELIQSELAFMAVAVTALAVLDSRAVRTSLVSPGARWWPLLVVGVLAAGAFSVRREGLAAIGAIGVAQVAALAVGWSAVSMQPRDLGRLVGRLAAPFAAVAATLALFEILLPSTIVPGYSGTGLHNVVHFASDHLGHVMQTIGLQQVAASGPSVLGSSTLGVLAVALFLVLLAVGAGLGVWRRPRSDLPILAFGVAALLIGGSFRTPGSRYMAIVGPIALVFVLGALRELSRRLPQRRLGASIALALVVALALGNLVRVVDRVVEVREFTRSGAVEWGPDHPDSLEMFAAVEQLTPPDAVVGFFKARAMTQRTDRRALQVTEFHPVERNLDVLTHVVFENTPANALEVTLEPDRYTELWSNPRFTLHEIGN